MPIRINSNIAALNAQRRLGESTAQLGQSYTRLSSGLRINRASDDAAGLAIASGLNADARVYTQGIRNINDALSVLDVAEAALGELSNIVNRQLELAQQSANGVLSTAQRKALDQESAALNLEYNRIIETTSFNGVNLLDLTNTSFIVQAGYGAAESLRFSLGEALGRPVSDGVYTISDTLGGPSRGHDILTVDLNGDGHLDTVMAQEANDIVTVNLGSGDGQFTNAAAYATGDQPYSINAGDINGDGKIDLLTIDNVGNTYSVLLGNGNGTFGASRSYATGLTTPNSSKLEDINGDGRVDLIAGDGGSGMIAVFLGQVTGGFGAAQTFSTGASAGVGNVALIDMNSDGFLDAVTTNQSNNSVSVILGTGTGSFGAARTYLTSGWADGLAAGDVNNDGTIDIVVGLNTTSSYNVLLGNSDGSFKWRTSFATAAGGRTYLVDLDGDGILDMAQHDSGSMHLYYGNGNGSFTASTLFTSSSFPRALAFGDFNEDGVIDIANANHNGPGGGYIFLSGVTETTLMPILHINTQDDALEALDFYRAQLSRIGAERGNVGSMQSRLSVAANVLEQRRENYISAASQILDVDVAQEAANLVRTKILQQAGTAILSQANQTPALALVLLDGRRR